MSNTGKQSPLGVNVMSGLIQGKGFWINKPAASYMGVFTPGYTSTTYNDTYTYTNGSISSLNKLTGIKIYASGLNGSIPKNYEEASDI
jgi:hypothetical protein